MEIIENKIPIRDIVNGYVNDDENGVTALDDNLDIRPKYQREFVYKEAQRNTSRIPRNGIILAL